MLPGSRGVGDVRYRRQAPALSFGVLTDSIKVWFDNGAIPESCLGSGVWGAPWLHQSALVGS